MFMICRNNGERIVKYFFVYIILYNIIYVVVKYLCIFVNLKFNLENIYYW